MLFLPYEINLAEYLSKIQGKQTLPSLIILMTNLCIKSYNIFSISLASCWHRNGIVPQFVMSLFKSFSGTSERPCKNTLTVSNLQPNIPLTLFCLAYHKYARPNVLLSAGREIPPFTSLFKLHFRLRPRQDVQAYGISQPIYCLQMSHKEENLKTLVGFSLVRN